MHKNKVFGRKVTNKPMINKSTEREATCLAKQCANIAIGFWRDALQADELRSELKEMVKRGLVFEKSKKSL